MLDTENEPYIIEADKLFLCLFILKPFGMTSTVIEIKEEKILSISLKQEKEFKAKKQEFFSRVCEQYGITYEKLKVV